MSDVRSVTASFAANPPPEDPPVVTPTPTPTTPTIQPVTPIVSQIDLVPPALAKLALSSTSFRAARSGRGVVAIAATTGTRVAISLSEAAKIGLRVQVLTKSKRWATKRGSLSIAGKPGVNRFRFTGRINGRALAPGRYRLVVTARDAAGNLSAAKRIGFRIVR